MAVLAVIVLVVIVGGGAYVYHKNHKTKTVSDSTSTSSTSKTSKTSTNDKTATTTDPYAGWQTYTSTEEKATFKYPSNWTVDTADQYASNDSAIHDYTGLKSPDGKVLVRWTSKIDGFGNEHSANYPYTTAIDKTPVTGAASDYVVSGITTADGSTYYPWIALENDAAYGALSTGVAGSLDTFLGRNNLDSTTGQPDTALFSTSGPRVNQGAPALSQSDAQAYLSSADMQQAKLILESFSH